MSLGVSVGSLRGVDRFRGFLGSMGDLVGGISGDLWELLGSWGAGRNLGGLGGGGLWGSPTSLALSPTVPPSGLCSRISSPCATSMASPAPSSSSCRWGPGGPCTCPPPPSCPPARRNGSPPSCPCPSSSSAAGPRSAGRALGGYGGAVWEPRGDERGDGGLGDHVGIARMGGTQGNFGAGGKTWGWKAKTELCRAVGKFWGWGSKQGQ